jgi:hypothetical protein
MPLNTGRITSNELIYNVCKHEDKIGLQLQLDFVIGSEAAALLSLFHTTAAP